MKPEFVMDDGRVVVEEDCGCAASNGFFIFLKPANGTMILRPSSK